MNLLFKNLFLRFVVAAVVVCFGIGCKRSGSDEGWPPPVKDVDDSSVLSPEGALQSFSVPPGFRVELVAAEPLIADPVAIDIDPNGRIWVVEMQGFNKALIKSEEDLEPTGRIVVLEDEDGNGHMDKSTTFLDSLDFPRSVLALNDGILVAEPPHLWLARDTTGNLKADEKILIRNDYGTAGGNPEHMANGLTWGMDNWIHSTYYAGRLRHTDGAWQYDSTLALGQWGLAMGSYGRFFRTWNSNPLFVAMLDPHYFARNPQMVEARSGYVSIANVSIANDSAKKVWPTRSPTWVDRGYRENVLREDSTLRTFTAASAPAVYRGDRYPEEFEGDVFVPEPAGHLVRRFEITRHEDGTLEAANAYDRAEFMTSTDERYRPVNLYSAPDGALYVVDMYRGIITWHRYLTPYLWSHIKRERLVRPTGSTRLGRIYRVVYEKNPPRREEPQLASQSSQELVKYLAHPNGWWRDTAQQLLVERGATEVAPALRKMARSAENELARLHALWTLEGMEALRFDTVRHALEDGAPAVRTAAVRVAEPWLQAGNVKALRRVSELIQDQAPEVRLQLAASLGEVPPPAADSAIVGLLTHASGQPYLVDAAVSGLQGRELTFLRRLVQAEDWNVQQAGYSQTLQTLAATIFSTGRSDQINRVLQLVGDRFGLPPWQRLALLDGIETLIPGSRWEGEGPLKLKQKPAALDEALQASNPEVRGKARRVAGRLVWPGKPGYTPPETTLLTAAAKRRFKEGKQHYQQVCAACHQSSGEGSEGIGASLVGSGWVLDEKKDLIRIVLNGKEGKMGLMPPHRSKLSNEEVAAILTYVRNAWNNKETPISPPLVEEVRNATATRDRPWTDEELRVRLH